MDGELRNVLGCCLAVPMCQLLGNTNMVTCWQHVGVPLGTPLGVVFLFGKTLGAMLGIELGLMFCIAWGLPLAAYWL